jgi:hypothetical protein
MGITWQINKSWTFLRHSQILGLIWECLTKSGTTGLLHKKQHKISLPGEYQKRGKTKKQVKINVNHQLQRLIHSKIGNKIK